MSNTEQLPKPAILLTVDLPMAKGGAVRAQPFYSADQMRAAMSAASTHPADVSKNAPQTNMPTGGSPEHMLQDQSRELSRWLSEKPDARLHAREAAAAIAKPAASGEQVAWWIPKTEQFALAMKDGSRPFAKAWEPLYTAHPAPALVPLTDEQIQAAWDSVDMRHPRGDATRNAFARAIEAAHGITAKEAP